MDNELEIPTVLPVAEATEAVVERVEPVITAVGEVAESRTVAIPTINTKSAGAKWLYMHSAPTSFGVGGVRANHRAMIINESTPGFTLQVAVINPDGTVNQKESREWTCNLPVTRTDTVLDGAWTDAQARSKVAPQTLDTSKFVRAILYAGDAQHPPVVAFEDASGGRKLYRLSYACDHNGRII